MRTADVLAHFGSVAKVAEALEISDKAVYAWGDEVPELRAFQLERITRKRLRVDSPQIASPARSSGPTEAA